MQVQMLGLAENYLESKYSLCMAKCRIYETHAGNIDVHSFTAGLIDIKKPARIKNKTQSPSIPNSQIKEERAATRVIFV